MVGKFKFVALAGALMMAATPVFAQDVIQDTIKGLGDFDPLHILSPEPAPAPAAAPAAKMHHHKMMHHKMMKKKMGGKKMMMKKKMMKKKM